MPKRVDLDLRRREFADAAVAAIDRRGLDGVRLVDVAAEAGVSTGALAHVLGRDAGKDGVLRLALEACAHELFDSERLALSDDLAAMLAQYLPLDEARRRQWRVWVAFQGRAVFDRELAELHRRYYRDLHEHIVAEFARLGLEGRADPDLAADAIIAAVDGVGLRATLEPDLWPAERQRALLAEQLASLRIRLRGDDHA